MKILIVEDDFASRLTLKSLLSKYGECDFAVNGLESLEAVKIAYDKNDPYDLICMDIMMPEMDGQEALKKIREYEDLLSLKPRERSKVIMTSALDDPKDVVMAFHQGVCDAYLIKPLERVKLVTKLIELKLIRETQVL